MKKLMYVFLVFICLSGRSNAGEAQKSYENSIIFYPGFEFVSKNDHYRFSLIPSVSYERAINENLGLEFCVSGMKTLTNSSRYKSDFHFSSFGFDASYYFSGFSNNSFKLTLGNGYSYEFSQINSSSVSVSAGFRSLIYRELFWDWGIGCGYEIYRNKKSKYSDNDSKFNFSMELGFGLLF